MQSAHLRNRHDSSHLLRLYRSRYCRTVLLDGERRFHFCECGRQSIRAQSGWQCAYATDAQRPRKPGPFSVWRRTLHCLRCFPGAKARDRANGRGRFKPHPHRRRNGGSEPAMFPRSQMGGLSARTYLDSGACRRHRHCATRGAFTGPRDWFWLFSRDRISLNGPHLRAIPAGRLRVMLLITY